MRRVAVLVVLALAGLLFTTSARTAGGGDLRAESRDLPGLIGAETSRVEDREARVESLRADVDALASTGDAGAREAALAEDLAPLERMAGLEATSGPGVVVELSDVPRDRPVPEDVPLDDLVVHQQDVQAVVNALWAAGARAMVLQDQRVVSTTAFRCAGNIMVLHGRVYSPPYRVAAVGDPEALRAGLLGDPAVQVYLEYAEAYGLGWSLRTEDDLRAPAYEGALEMRYAEPAAA